MTPGLPADELVTRVAICRFLDTRDVIPRAAEPDYEALLRLVAPERPPVRADLMELEQRRLRVVDDSVRALLGEAPASAWLRQQHVFRTLEKAGWTAGADHAQAVLEAAERAREAIHRATKTLLPCWSPIRCRPAMTRGIDAVELVTCLVLDYDDGTTIDDAVVPWLDWPFAVATTWSHRPGGPRFRLVLVLDRPVPAEAWPRVWHWAAARAVGQVDPACKDPSRIYALPAVRAPDAPYERRVHDPGGYLINVDWERLPEPAIAPPPRAPAPARRPPSDAARASARRVLKRDAGARRRAAEFLGAALRSRRAEKVRCPACSRPSVWFWLEPGAQSTAQCNHKGSCGWWGHLDELLDASGGPHVT